MGREHRCSISVQLGYTILEQNARTPHGELDIVARLSSDSPPSKPFGITVFVEVKTRSSNAFGLPEESITLSKKAHLLAAAEFYLQKHPELEGDWRIDVIAIRRGSQQIPEIVHFEAAIP